MLFLHVLSLLLFKTLLVSTADLNFHCSIVHSLPISSDRIMFSMAYDDERNGNEFEEVCIIASVAINSTGSSVSFPVYRSIELFYPAIPFIGPNLFRQFNATTVHLELRMGSLQELYYGLSALESLRISGTGLRTFDVLPVPQGTLQTLAIHEPNIETLPANIAYLTGLKMLDLSSCSLKAVDLGTFDSLVALKVLSFADNRLSTFTVGSDTRLPNLILFDVRQNQLVTIDQFPEMFPALKYTRLMQNRWDCEWVSAVREKLWHRKITVLGRDDLCTARLRNGGLCCSYSSPERARLAFTKTMLGVLSEVDSAAPMDESVKNGMKVLVHENETVDGVIGMEMGNVGVYLQDPIDRV